MAIVIRRLTPELYADYLDFFDNRAFADGNPNGPCYCVSPSQTPEEERQMVQDFARCGVKETLRSRAVQLLQEGRIHGYLAYGEDDRVVGWCNAGDMDGYTAFVPETARRDRVGRTVSIVCLEVISAYRGRGLAMRMISRVCGDAKQAGYAAVEGYAAETPDGCRFDYTGPVRLYEKCGFQEAGRGEGRIIMRRML